MRLKSILLSGGAIGVLLVAAASPSAVLAKTIKKPAVSAEMQRQIDELREQVQFLKDRLDEQANVNQQDNAKLKAAQADAEAAKAQAAASAAQAQQASVAEAQAIKTIPTEVKTQVAAIKPAPSWADNTSVNGRMYYNMSSIEQKSNGTRVAPSGFGFDVKRFYVGIDHKFNNMFSANVTTDFNYSAPTSETQVFIKKAFLQAKISDQLVVQAGANDMPWIPFMEGLYGNRYVEQTIDDRLKYGTSSDWGLHAQGKVAGGLLNYDFAVIDGAGYKAPLRSKTVDFEGRVNTQIDKLTLAIGGYTGELGKATVGAATRHTATRFNAAAAWVDKSFRVGAEYFEATNWNNVLTTTSDKAEGYSLFGTYYFATKYSAFANYQWVQPNKTTNSALKDNYFNIGLSYSPTKIVDLALVYKRDRADNGSISTGNGTIGGSKNGTYDELGVFTQLRW